ncbi:hypothetical protein KV572_29620, partial [Pseudomonas yamanorum]|uniref:hypothetical protein n=1 Tax=Pseudomonas yamanorum TaxID=515393 RepID=UPI001C458B26
MWLAAGGWGHIRCCGDGRLWFRSYSHPFQGLGLKSPNQSSQDDETMWEKVLERFEKQAPASVM